MPRTVTVGLDGTMASAVAADWAAREALLRGLPLRLVHVWPADTTDTASSSPDHAALHWLQRVLSEAEAELGAEYPGLEISTGYLDDTPLHGLLAVAQESEVLVVGSRGMGPLAGFLLGSTGLSTVARAECPVVLIRSGHHAAEEHRPGPDGAPSTSTPQRPVILGVGLDHPCDTVLEFAFDAASRRATSLLIVHDWDRPYTYGYSPAFMTDTLLKETESAARRTLADLVLPWRSKFPQVAVQEQTGCGEAVAHIVRAASDASLVVVGRRSRHHAAGPKLGPVAHGVLHHAGCPVAVVPHL